MRSEQVNTKNKVFFLSLPFMSDSRDTFSHKCSYGSLCIHLDTRLILFAQKSCLEALPRWLPRGETCLKILWFRSAHAAHDANVINRTVRVDCRAAPTNVVSADRHTVRIDCACVCASFKALVHGQEKTKSLSTLYSFSRYFYPKRPTVQRHIWLICLLPGNVSFISCFSKS